MGRENRDRKRIEAHDKKTAKYESHRDGTHAPQLTRKELEKLMNEYPGAVSNAHPVAGGKFEVHFHRGKRPPGV